MKAIIAENVSNSTITSSSENSRYDFDTALNDSRLTRVGRTTSILEQWLKFSFSEIKTVDTICIFKNNFTPNAIVKLQANNSDSRASPEAEYSLDYIKDDAMSIQLGYDVGVWVIYIPDVVGNILDSDNLNILDSGNSPILSNFNVLQYKYFRLYIDDPENTNDYLEIGFIFLDESVTFPGMSVNQVFKRNTTSEPAFSVSGQAYGLKRLQYNEAAFTFSSVTKAEKTLINKFFDKTDTVTPHCVLVWENSLDVQKPLYVVNTTLPEWKRVETNGGVLWAFNNSIREVK